MNKQSWVVRDIPIDQIVIDPSRRRPRNVEGLAESINEVGLISPVAVTKDNRLIYGGNRVAAYKSLGRTEIPAITMDLDDLAAELAEIDENLIRNELTVLERSEQLKRRKEVYEAKYPETRHGVAGGKARQGIANEMISFADDTASKIGVDRRTIQQEVQIAEKITPAARDIIRRTGLANQKTELLSLARQPASQQELIVTAIAIGDAKCVAGAIKSINGSPGTKEEPKALSETVQECVDWIKANGNPSSKTIINEGGFSAGTASKARKALGVNLVRGNQKPIVVAAVCDPVPGVVIPPPCASVGFDTYMEWMKVEDAIVQVFSMWPKDQRAAFVGGINTLGMKLSRMRR